MHLSPPCCRGCNDSRAAGAEFAVIACNSAHHWHARLESAQPLPILHIADAVHDELQRTHPQGLRAPLMVLGTRGVQASRIYQQRIGDRVPLRACPESIQPLIDGAIRAVKAGDPTRGRELAADAARRALDEGAKALLLACTELPIALRDDAVCALTASTLPLHWRGCASPSRAAGRAVEKLRSETADPDDAPRGTRPHGRAFTLDVELGSLCAPGLAHSARRRSRRSSYRSRCFAALAYRHLQQPLISITVRDAAGSKASRIACAVPEPSTLPQLIAVVVEQRRSSRAAPLDAAVFDIELALVAAADAATDGGAVQALELSSESASRARVSELALQLEQLIRQAAICERADVCAYSLVTPNARALLPDARRPIETPAYVLVTECVLEQARSNPNRCALVEAERSVSYRELVATASAVATRLLQTGVRAGDVVGLCGRRGCDVVSAMLGVFLSGAVLLTLDPKLPAERRRAMLLQSGARWLIDQDSEPALAGAAWTRLPLGALAETRSAPGAVSSSEFPALDRMAPAYIFFTSGSTGTPKAVVGTHAGLAHFLDWERSCFALGADARAAQLISLSFDAVLRDVFVVLTCGGRLCLPPEEEVLNPTAILPWLARERVTLLHMVPSLLRAWLSHIPEGLTLPDLRHLLLSGEPLTDVLVKRFRELFGSHTQLVNLYGPTETTMVKCFHQVREVQAGVQPIGQPMPQTQVLILNGRQQLCGLEERGQIAIRTPFRTLGYLNALEATQRAFIHNPFRDDARDLDLSHRRQRPLPQRRRAGSLRPSR